MSSSDAAVDDKMFYGMDRLLQSKEKCLEMKAKAKAKKVCRCLVIRA